MSKLCELEANYYEVKKSLYSGNGDIFIAACSLISEYLTHLTNNHVDDLVSKYKSMNRIINFKDYDTIYELTCLNTYGFDCYIKRAVSIDFIDNFINILKKMTK